MALKLFELRMTMSQSYDSGIYNYNASVVVGYVEFFK
jgi:hypothetical protein